MFRKGNKVILRPILGKDVPKFFVWMNDPEVSGFLSRVLPISLEQENEWFQKYLKDTTKINLAIIDIENEELIGSIGIHGLDYISGIETTGAVIGNKQYWGKGYGTEAKMLFLEYIFHQLNLRKIYSEVMEFNERSINYSLKCGYVKEATLPDHYYKNGQYWDKIILALYRKPWEKLWQEFSKNFK